MVWVNLSAAIISAIGSAVALPNTLHSLRLMLANPALLGDVMLLSATCAVGLIVLLNTIAAFGALTSSTIMTVRQFLSILINAGLFGNFGAVVRFSSRMDVSRLTMHAKGLQGWLGVMWVASGIFIKMDRRFDEPKKPKPVLPQTNEVVFDATQGEHGRDEKEALMADMSPDTTRDLSLDAPAGVKPAKPKVSPLKQYGWPLVTPIFLALILSQLLPLFLGTGPSPIWSAAQGLMHSSSNLSPADLADGDTYTPETQLDVAIQGGLWGEELHSAISPQCSAAMPETRFYSNPIPYTALATYPRTGNTFLRSLVEKATGYRTSSGAPLPQRLYFNLIESGSVLRPRAGADVPGRVQRLAVLAKDALPRHARARSAHRRAGALDPVRPPSPPHSQPHRRHLLLPPVPALERQPRRAADRERQLL